MSSGDDRRRPQFGEYATPDEQRKAIKIPLDHREDIPVISAPVSPAPVARDEPSGSPGAGRSPSAAIAPPDRIATYLLLGIGLFSVISMVPALSDLPNAIAAAFAQLEIGEYTSTGLAAVMGWTALGIQGVLWILALLWSQRAIRRGKLSWWIPLVIGVIANIALLICVSVAMAGDPAFTAYVNQMQ